MQKSLKPPLLCSSDRLHLALDQGTGMISIEIKPDPKVLAIGPVVVARVEVGPGDPFYFDLKNWCIKAGMFQKAKPSTLGQVPPV